MEDVVMPVVMLTLFVGLPAVVLLAFLVLMRRVTGHTLTIDLRGLYFYLVSFVSLLLAFFALLSTTGQALDLALNAYYPAEVVTPVMVAPPTPTAVMETPTTPSTPESPGAVEPRTTELQTIPPPKPAAYDPSWWARQQVAQSVALVLVALPVWWLHWRRARRLAEENGELFPLRLYLYGMMAVGLIAMVVMAAQALGGGLQWVLKSVPNGPIALRVFWKDMLSAGLNALIALTLWWYHRRTVESLPPPTKKEEGEK